jgi:hypothetical protein
MRLTEVKRAMAELVDCCMILVAVIPRARSKLTQLLASLYVKVK